MSSFAIRPEEEHLFFEDRLNQIKNAIFLFYDYVNDHLGVLEEDRRRSLIFDYEEDRVLLVFPLIKVELQGFTEKCHWEDTFEFLGEIQEEEKVLHPSDSFPRVPLTLAVSDFLNVEDSTMIQDIPLGDYLNISLAVKIRSNTEVREVFAEWQKSTEMMKTKVTRLEIGSQLMRISEEQYRQLMYENTIKKLEMIICYENMGQDCENIISDIIYEYLVDTMVFSDSDWWVFTKGLWTRGGDNDVWLILSRDIINFLHGEIHRDEIMIGSLIRYMGSVSTRSRILKDLSMKLKSPSFSDKLNSTRNIIRVSNGTYNLKKGILRESLPYDYFSFSFNVRYLSDIPDEDKIGFVKILRQIFPREEVLKFFVRSCTSFLEGYNKHKLFYIWWGKGNNAKTLLQRFMMSIFGDYAITLSTSLITGKRTNSSDATPDMHFSKNRLLIFLQEPNPDEKIQVGRIKELTGNDKVYTRDLYKPASTMEFKAKLVIVANNALEIPNMDMAFRRRIVVIPFESTFTDNPKGEFQFPIDTMMEEKIFKYKEVFLNILLREYPRFDNEELLIPEHIRETTLRYMTLNNHCLKYIQSYLHRKDGSSVPVNAAYNGFKEWFRDAYPGRRIPTISNFSNEMRNEGYDEDGNVYLNVDFAN